MKKIIVIMLFILFLTGCNQEVITTRIIPSNDNLEVYEHHVVKSCILDVDGIEYTMKILENNVDKTTIGTYEIIYSYEYDEQTYYCTRTVFVTDQTPPVVTLNPGIDTLVVGETWEDSGVSVVDNYDTEFNVTINNVVDTSQVGTYVVEYNVTDLSGNQTTISRIVTVIE